MSKATMPAFVKHANVSVLPQLLAMSFLMVGASSAAATTIMTVGMSSTAASGIAFALLAMLSLVLVRLVCARSRALCWHQTYLSR